MKEREVKEVQAQLIDTSHKPGEHVEIRMFGPP